MTDISLFYQMALIALIKERKVENTRELPMALFYIRYLDKGSLIQWYLVRGLTDKQINMYRSEGRKHPSQEEIANVKTLGEMARNPIWLEQKRSNGWCSWEVLGWTIYVFIGCN